MNFFAEFHWNTDPEIASFGPLTFRWYGLLFASGFVLGYFIVKGIYRREKKPEHDLETLLTWLVVTTVIGARLGHCLFYEPQRYLANPIEIFKVWEGGLASHGGGIAILIGLWLYSRSRPDQPFLWLLDRLAAPTALAAAFIRIGNFFNSEIVGKATDAATGVVFERLLISSPLHPAQLYEAVAYLFIFAILYALYRRWGAATPRGRLIGLFFIFVFGARFAIEFVKMRQAAWIEDFDLSVGQLLSIPAIMAGLILVLRSKKNPAESAE